MPAPKPEPVVTSQVCSVCGLDWSRHSDKPTAAECIDLLKSDLARRPVAPVIVWNEPVYIPAVPPNTWQPQPYWQNPTITCTSGTTTYNASNGLTLLRTEPDDDDGLAGVAV